MTFLRNNPALKDRRRELRRNQTEAEKTFWMHVRKRQLHGLKFFRQYSIGPYILDFYCPALMLAVELDGGHHNQPDTREYDSARSEYLNAQGVEVLRFWNQDMLNHVQSVLARVEEKITPPSLPFTKGEERCLWRSNSPFGLRDGTPSLKLKRGLGELDQEYVKCQCEEQCAAFSLKQWADGVPALNSSAE